jgi:hypothetical protein
MTGLANHQALFTVFLASYLVHVWDLSHFISVYIAPLEVWKIVVDRSSDQNFRNAIHHGLSTSLFLPPQGVIDADDARALTMAYVGRLVKQSFGRRRI